MRINVLQRVSTKDNRVELEVAVIDAVEAIRVQRGDFTIRGFYNYKISAQCRAEFSFQTFERLVDKRIAQWDGR